MKLQKDKRKKKLKLPLALSLIILAILLSGGVLTYLLHYKDNSSNNSRSPSASDIDQSQNLKDNPDDKREVHNTDKPTAPEEPNPATHKQRVQLEASVDKSDDAVFIRGGINYPVSGGRCFAKLTSPSGQVITKETGLLQGPASTDCQTISIPLSELTRGKWSFTLNYDSDNYMGVSANAAFTI